MGCLCYYRKGYGLFVPVGGVGRGYGVFVPQWEEVDCGCAKSVCLNWLGLGYYSPRIFHWSNPVVILTSVARHLIIRVTDTVHFPHQTLLPCSYMLPISIRVSRHFNVPLVYWSG